MQQNAGKNVGLLLLCSVLAFVAGGMVVYLSVSGPQATSPITISTPLPTPTPYPSATPAPIRVYVSGAVRSPAVCRLSPGSILQDAVEAAGGPAPDADLDCLNLALELQDQQHVHVPREGESNPPPVISRGASLDDLALVDINTATTAELETLPGVGEVTAERIIAHREANGPFKTIEEIQNVSGVGPKTFERMREMIVVGQAGPRF